LQDCRAAGIDSTGVVESILAATRTHPRMFDVEFSSLPHYLRGGAMLLFSWDTHTATIERIVSRDSIYPLHDEWTHCWALYRRVTALRYRDSATELLRQSESERSFRLFGQLLSTMKRFDAQRQEHVGARLHGLGDADALVSEARFAFENSDLPACVSRLEAALGILHKLIVESAPLPRRAEETGHREVSTKKTGAEGRRSVLLVDDETVFIEPIADMLSLSGFDVTVASSVGEGLRVLVDRDFDVVVTDLLLPEIDGRELARSIRDSGCEAKVIALTAFAGTADRAGVGTDDFPVDLLLRKPVGVSTLVEAIRRLVEE